MFIVLFFSYSVSFVDAYVVPNWIFTLTDYWLNSKISSLEFSNALQYLHENNMIDLVMGIKYDIITNFLISSSIQDSSVTNSFQNCNDGWYVTGYFTPVEEDYFGEQVEIFVDGTTEFVKSDFIESVKIEGWGKTSSGYYVGWYDDLFHYSLIPLDSHGDPLVPQAIAVDSSVISQKSYLLISTLPDPWNKITFQATDIGPSIIGKHIDVYTGEGRQAELETFRITSQNNVICSELD